MVPVNAEALQAALGRNQRNATSEREAINSAYALCSWLPLPAEAIVSPGFNLAAALGQPTAVAVVAERVQRVPDTNRAPKERVDFFCYHGTGDVSRHHPGRTAKESMRPHYMNLGCNLFQTSVAHRVEVGAALHQKPPGITERADAPQLGATGASQLAP